MIYYFFQECASSYELLILCYFVFWLIIFCFFTKLLFQNEYEKRIIERDSQEAPGDDVSSHQSDNLIFLDVVGGVDKKGRIYGLGPEAAKYKPSKSFTS